MTKLLAKVKEEKLHKLQSTFTAGLGQRKKTIDLPPKIPKHQRYLIEEPDERHLYVVYPPDNLNTTAIEYLN